MKRSRIKVDPAKVRAWQERSRKALPRESRKRRASSRGNPDVWLAVCRRDGYRCVMPDRAAAYMNDPKGSSVVGRCFGNLTPHHLLKASHGGGYTEENLVSLCAFHNGWVEDHPGIAHALGLVRRAGE